jgi:uncharacterized 2Fe-2S/4Fe-4S cluster protein (DUF4445 family)
MASRRVLILEPISKRVSVPAGTTIYNALLALNFPISAFCGGIGRCGKCRVTIAEANAAVSPPTEKELAILGEELVSQGTRLACQTVVEGDCRVMLGESLLPAGSRILVDSDVQALGIDVQVGVDPLVHGHVVTVLKPTIEQPDSDYTRLKAVLQDEFSHVQAENIDDTMWEIMKTLPDRLRENGGLVTCFFQNANSMSHDRLIDIVAGDHATENYGLAVDIGTTTIVGYLINLLTGETAAISAMLNPQVSIGEDVVSRITFVTRNDGLGKAQGLVVGALNEILTTTCEKAGVSKNDVRDVVVVGNTAMHHLFFGLPTKQLAVSPFVPAFKDPINIRAKLLGLECNPNANVYSPPVIAGYVGTDTIGCLATARMDQFEKYTLLIDIGTNGELVLGNRIGLISGSCAAGSALEGAEISFGMRAAEGAIEGVTLDHETREPRLKVIGNAIPIGICGSGLIDVVAEMIRSKILTRSGRFNVKSEEIKNHPRIVENDGDYHYLLFDPATDLDKIENFIDYKQDAAAKAVSIMISQEDVRQVQLAKGAFLSGALLMLGQEQKAAADIEQVILAGAFGSYINKANAMFIGLFPEVDVANTFQIGNAAGMGAQLCLRSIESRHHADAVAHLVRYFEVSTSPKFQVEFAHSLYFPHFDLSLFPRVSEGYDGIPLR